MTNKKYPTRKPLSRVQDPGADKVAVRGQGRKKIPFDYKEIMELARVQCTQAEIAIHMGISPDNFSLRKRTDPKIQEAINRGRELGKLELRRKQFEVALGKSDFEGKVVVPPDRQLLIHLGKHILGQTDQLKLSGSEEEPVHVKIDYKKISDEELDTLEEILSKSVEEEKEEKE
jgi:hypothetical protein